MMLRAGAVSAAAVLHVRRSTFGRCYGTAVSTQRENIAEFRVHCNPISALVSPPLLAKLGPPRPPVIVKQDNTAY